MTERELRAEIDGLHAQIRMLSRPIVARVPAALIVGGYDLEVLVRPVETQVDLRLTGGGKAWTPIGLTGGQVEVRDR